MTFEGAGDIIARTSIIYICLLGGFRLMGKRQMGQMNVFDMVVILIIANAVQNAMIGQDSSLAGGLLSAFTLFALNFCLTELRAQSPVVARWIGGVPTLLVDEGEICVDNLKREHLTEEEVLMALREHGIESFDKVCRAVLETDGSISVVPKAEPQIRPRRRVKIMRHR
ncbi:MAG: putative rane protein [Cyanobacteria bacterium RYN_339]|nr:putative rane protein [Cyanobacteria bacterium RYN_339]